MKLYLHSEKNWLVKEILETLDEGRGAMTQNSTKTSPWLVEIYVHFEPEYPVCCLGSHEMLKVYGT